MKPKILIADDSPMNREILTDILGNEYEYLYADNGVQTLELLESNSSIDLLLLDIFMPELDGFGVLTAMNGWNWLDELPVVIISSEDNAEFIQRAYDLGAVDYICRPFNLTVIQRRVKNTLMLYARQKRLIKIVEQQVIERERNNGTMVSILSHVIEARNNESGEHLLHVRTLTELLLRQLVQMTDKYDLTESDISRITTMSALHDIGKISVPKAILNKPGKLDADEWEIMKGHSAIGDQLLYEVPIDQNEPLMRTAHEICRWHHERWDGKGYPDGLKEDEIPISAQVVAMADVYDALTSERCYKPCFTHEQAIRMIVGGECGQFNPLLMQCLDIVKDKLFIAKQTNTVGFSWHSEAKRLTAEVFHQQDLPQEDRAHRISAMWQDKSCFFERECGGIQFSYDRYLHKVTFNNWYMTDDMRQKVYYLNEEGNVDFLRREDWLRIQQMILASTRENPDATAEMLVPVNGQWRWHRVHTHTIWAANSVEYAGAIGQFTDIHSEVLSRGALASSPLEGSPEHMMRVFGSMGRVFDVVRLVDPETHRVLTFREDGRVIDTEECCYAFWNRKACCSNCTSMQAFDDRGWKTKFEMKGDNLYCVISRYQMFGKRRCVLEIAIRLDDHAFSGCQDATPGTAGAYLLNFYRDSISHAYSRLYLDAFLPNLENADAVGFLDIDDFKCINDTYGHHIGDRVIEQLGTIAQTRIRPEDRLIRYGGDEFVLIFPRINEDAFHRRLEEIRAAVQQIVIEECPELHIDLSYGGAYGVTPLADAIRQADAAMYEMKQRKKAMIKDGNHQ